MELLRTTAPRLGQKEVSGGLDSRRADTAHAPQLVSDSFDDPRPPTPRLRAPQAVVKKSHAPRLGCTSWQEGGWKSRILRSLCEGRNSFAMEKNRTLRGSAAHLLGLQGFGDIARVMR